MSIKETKQLVSMREYVLSDEAWVNNENKIDVSAYSWNVRNYANLLSEFLTEKNRDLFDDESQDDIDSIVNCLYKIETIIGRPKIKLSSKGLKRVLIYESN